MTNLSLAQSIAQQHFGTPAEVTQLSGQNHTVFRLQFPDHSAIVKLAKGHDPSTLAKEIHILALLHQHAIPAPQLLHADLTAPRPWLLLADAGTQSLAQLTDHPDADRLFTDMGRLLANVHAIIFPASGIITATGILTQSHEARRQQLFLLADELTRANLLTPPESATFKALPFPQSEGLSLCHGDFHPIHCLIQNAHISALIDWESAWSGNPNIDLAMTHAYLDFYIPAPRTRHFLEGYASVHPIPANYSQIYRPIHAAQALSLARIWLLQAQPAQLDRAMQLFRHYRANP